MKRSEQAELTRQKLLETGRRLIKQADFDKLTVSDIAKECDVSFGLLYHYFDSKEDFFLAVGDQPFNDLSQHLADKEYIDPIAVCEEYILHCLEMIEDVGTSYAKFYFGHADARNLSESERGQNVMALDARVQAIRDYLNACIQAGTLSSEAPVEKIAMLITATLAGITASTYVTENYAQSSAWIETFRFGIEALIKPYLIDFIG